MITQREQTDFHQTGTSSYLLGTLSHINNKPSPQKNAYNVQPSQLSPGDNVKYESFTSNNQTPKLGLKYNRRSKSKENLNVYKGINYSGSSSFICGQTMTMDKSPAIIDQNMMQDYNQFTQKLKSNQSKSFLHHKNSTSNIHGGLTSRTMDRGSLSLSLNQQYKKTDKKFNIHEFQQRQQERDNKNKEKLALLAE